MTRTDCFPQRTEAPLSWQDAVLKRSRVCYCCGIDSNQPQPAPVDGLSCSLTPQPSIWPQAVDTCKQAIDAAEDGPCSIKLQAVVH